jgi:hypothetical protein
LLLMSQNSHGCIRKTSWNSSNFMNMRSQSPCRGDHLWDSSRTAAFLHMLRGTQIWASLISVEGPNEKIGSNSTRKRAWR